MRRTMYGFAAATLALSIVFVSTALAEDEADRPIPEARQTRLLEKFGDEGIDANANGVLTREEVRAFFADQYPERMRGNHRKHDGHGPHGMKGCGHCDEGCAGHEFGARMPEAKLQKLLEKFGDEGIDANGDGTLTPEEAHAFLADKHPEGMRGKHRKHDGHGPHGMKGCGPHGRMGMGMGPKGGPGELLKHLELLNAETPPADFDLTRFPGADVDGNGELSASEWVAFTERARERVLARVTARFPDADANKDGRLDDAEVDALKVKIREQCLAKNPEVDTNGDGVLSEEESAAFQATRAEQRHARMRERHPEADLDGDGVLTEEEFRTFKESHPGPRGGKHKGHRREWKRSGECPNK